ncbi:MAG: hypothetical protein HYS66_07475 [Deltaproteobacteria bacterium]|nr:hypothetical protein [Deltaproteobacteria bacterium]
MVAPVVRALYCLFVLLIPPRLAGAQDLAQQIAAAAAAAPGAAAATPAAEEDPVAKWWRDHVKGSFRSKTFASFQTTLEEQRTVRQEGLLRLEINQDLGQGFGLFLVPQWKADSGNYVKEPWMNFRDSTFHDPYFSFNQGYLRYRAESFDVTVGKQIYSWGTADGYNPTDYLLNPWDYQDIPDREKLGVFSISANYYLPNTSFQFIVMPHFTPSRIPMVNNRWLGVGEPARDLLGPFAKLALPLIDFIIKDGRKLPPKRFENTQVAFRAKTSAISGWDLSLSYFDGYDNLPVVSVGGPICVLVPTLGPVCVGPPKTVFPRVRAVGADFSTTFGKLEVHGEAVAKFYDAGLTTDRMPVVIGGRYVWDQSDVGGLGLEQILFVLEYGHDFDLHKRDNPLTRDLSFFVRPIQSTIISRVGFKIDDANELTLSGAVNFYGPNSGYLQPKYSYKFTDNLKAEVGFDVFWGDFSIKPVLIPPGLNQKLSFWGKWDRNDRGFLNLTYLF